MLSKVKVLTALVALLTGVSAVLMSAPVQAETTLYAPVSPTGSALLTTRPVPLVGSGEVSVGAVGTEVYFTRRTSWLVFGHRALLEGQVATVDGALPDAPVRLLAQPHGRSWRPIATTRTSTDSGVFRFRHKPWRTTRYRVEYAGEWAYTASETEAVVKVRRKITSDLKRNADGTFAMRGHLAPKSPGKTVRLQRKTCRSCSWSVIKSTSASRDSTFRFRFSGPSRQGTWFFRAITPRDPAYLKSFGDVWALRRS
ncbi:MAG: hypothetical protein GEU97_20780 [Actinophytocola sp.]|nr:hypothetical protein [Actinophytocola sp.]